MGIWTADRNLVTAMVNATVASTDTADERQQVSATVA